MKNHTLRFSTIGLLFLAVILSFSCNNQNKETDNPYEYRTYISFNTNNRHSTTEPIVVELVKPLKQFELNQEIPSKYMVLSPSTEGKLYIDNGITLRFVPKNRLEPDTKYTVTIKLGELYDSIPKKFKTYTFSFKTIAPDFKINLGNLQSYDKKLQYLEGTLESADYINPEKLPDLLKAMQNDKALHIIWKDTLKHSKFYHFIIDSIKREADASKIHISWNGKRISSDTKGENDYTIPGYNNFKIINIKTETAPKASLSINFSDPLDPDQNFAGLVKIDKIKDLRFEVDGNVLYVYPSNRVHGNVKLTVYQGIKSTFGSKLKTQFSTLIAFQQLKPAVQLVSKGVILPSAQSTPLYFKAVNLSAVDVRVIKIYENNILQFLQSNDLSNTSTYRLRRVGRSVAKKTIHLDVSDNKKGTWKAFGIKLSDFFKADPGALYRIEFSFKKSYSSYECDNNSSEEEINNNIAEDNQDSQEAEEQEKRYWDNEDHSRRNSVYDWRHRDDPCYDVYYQSSHFVSTNILGSDIGLIAKKGSNNTYRIFITNLLNAKPVSGASVKLYNYQQQVVASLKTDKNGEVNYDGKKTIAFVIAQKGNDYAYTALNDGNSLSMSKFDISGSHLQKGLKGFIYTERGVYRPGDTIHLTFVLNDKANPLPAEVPVKLEVKNARGKLVQRTISAEGKKSSSSRALNRFYYFPVSTNSSDPTGNWYAQISVGGAKFNKTIRVATVKPNRLKIKLNFDDSVLQADKPISGLLIGSWLHGAPGRNLKAEMNVTLTNDMHPFEKYRKYNFTDPVRNFGRTELPILETKLSSEGKIRFSKKIKLDQKAPGMLKATFLTKLFEGGGDFSIDVFSKKLAPYSNFVGLKSPETHRFGSFYTDEDNDFDVITLDAQGKISPNRKLSVQIYKIEWRWWWYSGRDNLSKYKDATIHKPVKDFEISTNSQGKGNFNVNIPKDERGRYLIRVKDEESGHATGRTTYFYRNWFENTNGSHPEAASMLVFSADKEAYKVGETAKVTFPSGTGGRALISIEDGTKVLSTRWVKTEKGETKVDIPLTKEMAPNIYVNISLLQPHDQVKNDLPIRLYGVIPIEVEDPSTILEPQLKMPDVLKPNEKFTVQVSEKNKKEMTYTIAMVDEGLLDLTRYKTPDIHAAFYSREALGVKTFDIYDYVIGAYSGSVNNIYEIGGDNAAKKGKKHKANRFKPVVKYLGPFHLKPGETQSHTIQMPNYIGAVRTMVVAGNYKKAAYGSTDKTTPVRKPLMVLASLPRKLSPGESVTLPVTVFSMSKKIKDAHIRVSTTAALQAVDGNSKTIHFNGPDEKIVNFKYKVKPSDKIQKITVNVSGNGEKAAYSVEFDVFNPNPITHKTTDYQLDKNDTKTLAYKPYGVTGSNSVKIELSTLPPMDFTKRIQYLIHYPHGCVEQTTSSGFPQLFLDDIFDLTYKRKKEIEKNVKATIQRLGDAQLTNGAMPFWPGNTSPNLWTTNYAGHFMLEAKKKGYALPISFLSSWLRFQKNKARRWNIHDYSYNSSLQQAYRLYTLALAGQSELSAMNRLRESDYMSNAAKWRLAAAYALSGKKEVASQIAKTANIDFQPKRYDYYTYGSPFRNEAMALETMVILGDPQQRDLAKSVAKKLSSKRWMSTQETSYGLLAMAEMVRKNGGKSLDLSITQNGKTVNIKTDKAIAERPLQAGQKENSVKITNKKSNLIYVSLYQEGKLPLGQELAQDRNLSLVTEFLDGNGERLAISKLRQGTEIEAKVTIKNTSNDYINDVALTQIFPSGWEIVNTSFTELKGGAKGNANYTDIRDDRVNFYFDLRSGKSKTFIVKLNASYLGRYYLPGTQAEGMYDNDYYARDKGQWVLVE